MYVNNYFKVVCRDSRYKKWYGTKTDEWIGKTFFFDDYNEAQYRSVKKKALDLADHYNGRLIVFRPVEYDAKFFEHFAQVPDKKKKGKFKTIPVVVTGEIHPDDKLLRQKNDPVDPPDTASEEDCGEGEGQVVYLGGREESLERV